MASSIRFSVIVPAYGVEAYIYEALDCLAHQSYDNYQVIVVEDCSFDKTGSIADEFANKYNFITCIHHDTNQGVSAARNTGIEAADGDYFLFIDPDDTVRHDLLACCASYLQKNPVDELIYGYSEDYRDAATGHITYSRTFGPVDLGLTDAAYTTADTDEIHALVMKLEHATMLGYPWDKCYKASLIREHGIRFQKIKHVEDILFNCDMMDYVTSLTIIPEVLYHYRNQGQARLTGGNIDDYFTLQSTRLERLYQQQVSWGSLDEYAQVVLASVYFRSFQSQLVRFFDQGKDKKTVLAWCHLQEKTSLYQALKDHLPQSSRQLKFLYQPLAKGSFDSGLRMARLIYFVKKYMSGLFNKLKQLR